MGFDRDPKMPLGFQVERSLFHRLDSAAARLGLTRSALLRQFVLDGLDALDQVPRPLPPPDDLSLWQSQVARLYDQVQALEARLRSVEARTLEEIILHQIHDAS